MSKADIRYYKISLFDAPQGCPIVHGCNAQGVWGSGIAAPFKDLYPRSYFEYHTYCVKALEKDPKFGAVGTTLITHQENKRKVGCLVTSFDYGKNRDTPEDILAQTYLALDSFCKQHTDITVPVYSNKFNSGMFKVPWEDTVKVLEYFVKRYNLVWCVCDPDMI